MIHYAGDIEAFELGERAKEYIPLYERSGEDVCLVAYKDLVRGRKRYVKFERLNDQWVFVDLVD